MIHPRDKRRWFAANFGRQYFHSAPLGLPGMQIGLIVPAVILAVVCLLALSQIHPSCVLALTPTIVSLKSLRQQKADLDKERFALIERGSTEGYAAVKDQITALKSKLEGVNSLIAEAEEAAAVEKAAEMQATVEAANGKTKIEVGATLSDLDPKGGFKDHRDFLRCVMNAGKGMRADDRLKKFQATQGSDEQQVGSDPYGGFLVPIGIAPGVMTIRPEEVPFDATPLPMEVPSLYVNARVDKDHTTSVSGGLVVYRKPETVDASSTGRLFRLTGHSSIRHSVEKGRSLQISRFSAFNLPQMIAKLPPENHE